MERHPANLVDRMDVGVYEDANVDAPNSLWHRRELREHHAR
jgi:hypothetical protein